jgi:hypothetical protein
VIQVTSTGGSLITASTSVRGSIRKPWRSTWIGIAIQRAAVRVEAEHVLDARMKVHTRKAAELVAAAELFDVDENG